MSVTTGRCSYCKRTMRGWTATGGDSDNMLYAYFHERELGGRCPGSMQLLETSPGETAPTWDGLVDNILALQTRYSAIAYIGITYIGGKINADFARRHTGPESQE